MAMSPFGLWRRAGRSLTYFSNHGGLSNAAKQGSLVIISVFVLFLVLAIYLTSLGRDMNDAPGTLADQPEANATAAL